MNFSTRPLPSTIIHPPPLSPSSKQQYIQQANKLLEKFDQITAKNPDLNSSFPNILQQPYETTPFRYNFIEQSQGLSVFRQDTSTQQQPWYVAAHRISGTLDEIKDLVIIQDTNRYRRLCRQNFQSAFHDGANLHNIVPRTSSNPDRYIGIKWLALKSGIGTHIRDYCFLEIVCVTKAQDGRLMVLHLSKSISEGALLPNFHDAYGFVRGKIDFGVCSFTMTSTIGTIEVQRILRVNVKGQLSSFFYHRLMLKLLRSTQRLPAMIQDERVRKMGYTNINNYQYSEYCYICVRRFRLLLKPWNCFVCGQPICRDCCTTCLVDLRIVEKKQVLVCGNCIERSKENPENRERERLKPVIAEQTSSEEYSGRLTEYLMDQLSLKFTMNRCRGNESVTIRYDGIYSSVATKVVLSGSWCDWRVDVEFGAFEMLKKGPSLWQVTISLSKGVYSYGFLIDGYLWANRMQLVL